MRFFFEVVVVVVFLDSILGFVVPFSEELEEFPRAAGSPGGPAPQVTPADKCKKDVVILVDTSYSIGKSTFESKVRPFLVDLVKTPKLNVAPDGTNIAMVIFSNDANTRLLFDFSGVKQTAADLETKINKMNWDSVKGDRTFTGKGFKIVYTKLFPKISPLNARPNIADVVILLTDGEPRGRRRGDQLSLAKKYSKLLKDNGVLIVGIAVGPLRLQFKSTIEDFSTSKSTVFDVEFDSLDKILNNIVDASCTPFRPGDCNCPTIQVQDVYIKPSETTAKVTWLAPTLQCKDNRVPTVQTTVSPNVNSPHDFPVGNHDIVYTYTFKQGFNMKCLVKIVVKSCSCSSVSRVVGYVSDQSGTTNVQWNAPVSTCPGSVLKSIAPNKPSGSSFGFGSHTISYTYHSSEAGFDLTCDVQIDVKVCVCPSSKKSILMKADSPNGQASVSWVVPQPNCPGQQIAHTTIAPTNTKPGDSFGVGTHIVDYYYTMSSGFNVHCTVTLRVNFVPCQGVFYDATKKMCCCGKLHDIKPGFICCGRKFIDSSNFKCCALNYNVMALTESCPVVTV